MTATRFRVRPFEVGAIRWTGDNIDAIWDTFGAGAVYGPTEDRPGVLIVGIDRDLADQEVAGVGDWVVCRDVGYVFRLSDAQFRATYEPLYGFTETTTAVTAGPVRASEMLTWAPDGRVVSAREGREAP